MATEETEDVQDLLVGDHEEKERMKRIRAILKALEKGGYNAAPSDLVQGSAFPGYEMEKVTTEFSEDSWTFYKPRKRAYYFDSVEEAQDKS